MSKPDIFLPIGETLFHKHLESSHIEKIFQDSQKKTY